MKKLTCRIHYFVSGCILALSPQFVSGQSSLPFYGPYVGVALGFNQTSVGENAISWTNPSSNGSTTGGSNSNANGFIGTLSYGFNWRSMNPNWQQFVLGAEITGSFSSGTSNGTAANQTIVNGAAADLDRISSQTKIQGLATAKPKFGFVIHEKTMLYAMGGLAWGQTQRTLTQETGASGSSLFNYGSSITSTKGQFGYTAGLGIERMISTNLSVKLEFNYIDLGTVNYTYSGVSPSPGNPVNTITQSSKITTSSSVLGLNYRF